MKTRFASISISRMLASFLDQNATWGTKLTARKNQEKSHVHHFGLESLEPRQLMTTYAVTSLVDNLTTTSGTLRWAVTQANLASGNTISFQSGLTGTINLAHGALSLTQPTSILGPGAANLTITADPTSGQIFSIQKTATVTLDALTLSQANASAINNLGTLTLTNSIFSNDASASGGAINNSGALTITNTQFINDSATGFHGNGGAISSHGQTLSVTSCTFTGNAASNFGNGAAIAVTSGTLSVANSTFTGNAAKTDGSAISNTSTGTIRNSSFIGVATSTSNSEMIFNTGTLLIDACLFSGNASAGSSHPGGAVANTGTLNISNSTITGNSVDVTAAFPGGGGIYNSKNLGLTNCTVVGNAAKTGGGIASEVTGTVTTIINNTIVAQNSGGDVSGTLAAASDFNLIGDGSGKLLTAGRSNILGSATLLLDPRIASLANNGGLTQTIALLPTSPAIDHGSNALAIDYLSNPLTTDQRGTGFARIIDSTVDMGAYESAPTNTTTTHLYTTSTSITVGQAVTFTATVTGTTTPTGGITFLDGTVSIGSSALVGGTGQFTTSTLAVGTHSITASYAGDTTNGASLSTPASIVVAAKSPNSTVLSFSPTNPSYGSPVTISASVTVLAGTPNGWVTFLDGTTTLGGASLNGLAIATFTTSTLAIGAHAIQGVYAGAPGFPASTSAVQPLYVGTPHQRFVAQLYRDLLGREVDPAGLNSWTTVLSAGASYSNVATSITSSREYDGIVVDNLYFSLLGRHAETAGLTAWVNQMQAGLNAEVIRAGILGSDEYYNRTEPGNTNGTDATFITALYTTFLGRAPDSGGLAAWEGVLGGNPANRQTVAKGISNSDENRTVIITGFFQTYLHRAPDAGGLAAWKSLLASGISQPSIISAFVTSPEYLGRLGITG